MGPLREVGVQLSIEDIMALMPHRYPFLMVDRVRHVDLDAGHIVALKNVTMNEQYFVGHVPGHPVMPGVLIVEGLAQAGGILTLMKTGRRDLAYFAAIDGFRFRRTVTPGDQLVYDVRLEWIRGRLVRALGKALVDDQVVSEGTLTFAFQNARDDGGK
ncbi:MAG: 3-hydroxyacyl-ACP dehydratase FabZ [Armatimonadetes bacterium]|nr:3-hydroxyacyl-ACP dehydratase FabZ [Armatimonadota bacterium]